MLSKQASLLIPLGLLGCTTVLAQPGLKLYGVVDNGAQYYRQGERSLTRLEPGIAATSRLGVLGEEDLGSGLYAGVWLESGLKTDAGTAGGTSTQGVSLFFNRQSNLVLGSRQWGEIRAGRQNPAQISPFLDTFAGVSGFSPWASLSSKGNDQGSGASVGDSRISNAVSYATPASWNLGGMVQAAWRGSADPRFKSLSAYGVELHYRAGSWFFQGQAMYNNTDPTATVPTFRNNWFGLAVQKKFGDVKASYIFTGLSPDRPGYRVSQTHALSLTVPVQQHTFRVSPVYRNVAGRHDLNSFALGLGYDYNFSKSTAFYVRVGRVINRAQATATLGAIAAGNPGEDLSTVASGVRVRF